MFLTQALASYCVRRNAGLANEFRATASVQSARKMESQSPGLLCTIKDVMLHL